MNELIAELNNLEGQVKALEAQALQHEQAARDCRGKRGEAKLRISELRANINDARVVHAAQGSMAAAEAAKGVAESHAKDLKDMLDRLAGKEKALDEAIAKAAVPATPPKTE